MSDINEIKQALEKATPGPWYTDSYDIEYDPFKDDHEKKEKTLGNIAKLANAYNPNKNHANDAELICLLRNEVPSLITTIESLQAEVKKHKWEDEQFSWLQEQIKTCASENTGLKSQIESQKEEIENQWEIIAHQGKGLLQERQQIESLKAITELAVKGLKEISSMRSGGVHWDGDDYYDKFCEVEDNAIKTLSEIERIQNATS